MLINHINYIFFILIINIHVKNSGILKVLPVLLSEHLFYLNQIVMKKFTILFSLVFIAAMSTEVNAQWSNTGNNYTTGTLRVGATIPFSTKKFIARANNTDAVAWLDNINNFGTGLIISAAKDVLRVGSLNNQLGNLLRVNANGVTSLGFATAPTTTTWRLNVNGSAIASFLGHLIRQAS